MRSTGPARRTPGRVASWTVGDAPATDTASTASVGSATLPVPGLIQASDVDQLRRLADQPDPLGGTAAGPELTGALARLRGRGRPLPGSIARSMGGAMGADLSQVRIHTGPEPAELARSVQASAFTVGRDIFFGAGTYEPRTPGGQRLLAHELAHTVQRDHGGGPGTGHVIGRATDPAEREADRVADGALAVLRRQGAADAPAAPTADPPGADTASTDDGGRAHGRIRRKVGFEAELMVPSLGPSANKLKYEKEDFFVTQDVRSFLDGGVKYGTDMGGKAEDADVRLDSDHGGTIDRTPIVTKLAQLGWVSGAPSEPRTKIEFVTTAVDELAPGANKRLREVGTALERMLTQTLEFARSGRMKQLGPPAKPGYKTGVPQFELELWLGDDYPQVEGLVKEYLTNGIADDVYLQATVGVVPSALMTFFARAAMTGGKVEVAPPSESRQQILGIVQEVVSEIDTTFADDEWLSKLSQESKNGFLGLLGLIYSYLLGDTLHQTTGGTESSVKNAVPFLIKISPYGLLARTAPHWLKKDPPSRAFVRKLGEHMKKSRYLQAAYWVEDARKDGTTAVGEGKLAAKLDARKPKGRLVTGDYTDFVEQVLLDSGGAVEVVVGKELAAPDKPPTNSGGINVFYELYNQQAIPLEYRAISKRYKISEVLPAIGEIVSDVRLAALSGLTEEQKAAVRKAYQGDG